MAIGAVLFSLPVAFAGALLAHLLHGFGLSQVMAAYSLLGAGTMLTILAAVGLAQHSME